MAYADMDKARANWRYHARIKLMKRYGITLEQYEEMLDAQNGVCAICGQPETTRYKFQLSVDHNHKTGKVRGLLCHMCNTGLGKFADDPQRLIVAANYLKESI